MDPCIFPACHRHADHTNRAGQPTCHGHHLVVVNGSYVGDRHDAGSGGEH